MKLITILLMAMICATAVQGIEIYQVSGTIGQTADDFCGEIKIDYYWKGYKLFIQNIKDCTKADYLDNELKNPKDCKVVYNKKTKEVYCVARKNVD